MKKLKMNYLLLVLSLSALGAFATSAKTNFVNVCTTIPTTSGPNIDLECTYNPVIQCCYITAGSSAQYVIQRQNTAIVTIRRSPSSIVTIFGNRND